VRGIGRLSRSHQISEIFEALQMLDSLPAEQKRVYDFLTARGEALDDARAVIAVYPARPGIPKTFSAIEVGSEKEAEKLEPEILKLLLSLSPASGNTTSTTQSPARASQDIHRRLEARGTFLTRMGSLICIADSKIDLIALRPANSKPMAADTVFESSRSRFATDPLFVYYNQRVHERVQQKETQEAITRQQEAEAKEKAEAAKRAATTRIETRSKAEVAGKVSSVEESADLEPPAAGESDPTLTRGTAEDKNGAVGSPAEPVASPTPPSPEDKASAGAAEALFGSLFSMATKWPDGIAAAVSFDGDDLVARVILLNKSGEPSAAIPFLPFLVTGPPITNRTSALAPADSEVFVSASLDFAKMFESAMDTSNSRSISEPIRKSAEVKGDTDEESVSTAKKIALLETFLGFRIKEDLISAFGNEVGFAIYPRGKETRSTEGSAKVAIRPAESYSLILTLQNRDAAQRMLPKVLEIFGLKAVGTGATERVNDIEITNYTAFAMAFVDDFLVVSQNNDGVRRIVEARDKQQILASSNAYRNSIIWQPQQRIAQVYLSQEMVDAFFKFESSVFDYAGDTGKAFQSRFRIEPRPVTFAMSNDGSALQHELHIPASTLLSTIAGSAISSKYREIINNEMQAKFALMTIASTELAYKEGKGQGSYGTLDDLVKMHAIPTYYQQQKAYKFEVTLSSDGFEATATPVEYGEKSKHSFFIDKSGQLRGGDLGGRRATESEPAMQAFSGGSSFLFRY
jgi:hypothetical protein